jgi:hypothetical protein
MISGGEDDWKAWEENVEVGGVQWYQSAVE